MWNKQGLSGRLVHFEYSRRTKEFHGLCSSAMLCLECCWFHFVSFLVVWVPLATSLYTGGNATEEFCGEVTCWTIHLFSEQLFGGWGMPVICIGESLVHKVSQVFDISCLVSPCQSLRQSPWAATSQGIISCAALNKVVLCAYQMSEMVSAL